MADKTNAEHQAAVAAIVTNLSDADGAFKDAILYLLKDVATLNARLAKKAPGKKVAKRKSIAKKAKKKRKPRK